VLSEQEVLLDLYALLMARLQAASGTLGTLSFSVRRETLVEEWANEGEELLDLRRQGAFRGQGRILELGNRFLKDAWETGDADAVSAAMAEFSNKHPPTIIENAPVSEPAKRPSAWPNRPCSLRDRDG
jgi:hypothetical protein